MGTGERETSVQNERARVISMLKEHVDGVGPKTAEAFYALDVRSWTDLQQYLSQHSDQEVREALREHGARIFPDTIAKYEWRAKVEDLAKTNGAAPAAEQAGDAAPAPDAPQKETAAGKGHDAQFTLFFDRISDGGREQVTTTVYENQGFGAEHTFAGPESTPWVNWILQRAGLPAVDEPRPAQDEAAPDKEVGEEAADEPDAPPAPGGPHIAIEGLTTKQVTSPSLTPEKRLSAEVRFQIAGAAQWAARRLPYRVEIHTVDVETRASTLVASKRGALEPQVDAYTSRQEFPFPPLGSYELHAVVLVLPPGHLAAYHQAHRIHIVE